MKLYQSLPSPFARMVKAVAIVKGIEDKIEALRARDVGVNIEELNPLGKVPTLVTDDGEVLIESALICQYLDDVGQGPKLYGNDAATRRRVLQLEALGHGMLAAGVACRMEEREHEPEMRSAKWIEHQHKKLRSGLAAIESKLDEIGSTLGVPHITYACALFWIDHHKVLPDWREKYPKLATWYAAVRQQPPLAKTEPEPA